ncbi:Forkhead-associated protein [Oscillatoriales cyanobacterium USR001]|nr:Forkhead-associated protein [Oscillatoriales cyanobacterium USR001]
MITLTLLHPTQSVSVQSWSFESEAVVRIGRSTDNDIIVYSAVVSRHHVELWNNPSGWEIINFGANGTYVNDEPITQVPVVDGMIIRLGNSGPKIRLEIGVGNVEIKKKSPFSKRSRMKMTVEEEEAMKSFLSRPPINKEDSIIENDNGFTQTDFE